MKEFKIWVKSTSIIPIQAEDADAALKIFQDNLKIKTDPIEFGIVEETDIEIQ